MPPYCLAPRSTPRLKLWYELSHRLRGYNVKTQARDVNTLCRACDRTRLRLVPFIRRDRVLHSGDGYLNLPILRLARRQRLKPQAGGEEDPHYGVVRVEAAEPYRLIAYRGHKGDQYNPGGEQPPQGVAAYKGEHRDRHDDYRQQERGAASRVRRWLPSHRLDIQGLVGLLGVNRHMLGAVVHEHPGNLVHSADQVDIGQKDPQPDDTLH